MDAVWPKLVEQAPWAAAISLCIYLFLNYLGKQDDKRIAHEKDGEALRTANATMRERERREHEMAIANLQANNMKQLIDNITNSMNTVAQALSEHERSSRERYEKMGITNDLLTAAKERLGRK